MYQNFPFILLPCIYLSIQSRSLMIEGGGLLYWEVEGRASRGNSVRHVSVMLAVSWPWLVSPPPGDDGIFTERVGRSRVRLKGGQAPWLLRLTRMCRYFCIFKMWCVWGSVWPSKYFPSWFSVSSFLRTVHQIHSVTDEKVLSVQPRQVLTNLSFRHKH